MNVLMGKVSRTQGSSSINGMPDELHHYKSIILYVPQEDIMIREMTVRETVLYSTKNRLPADWSSVEIEKYVNAVINTLGLSAIQNSLIGDETTHGVSGGQRKRVNIGMELAAAPRATFLGDPTSGLDSTAALSVVMTLKSTASLGVTVIAVLYQPRYEIFKAFCDLLLIVPGGRTAYLGPQSQVVQYFLGLGYVFDSRKNPADVLMDILSGRGKRNDQPLMTPEELAKQWASYEAKIHTRMTEAGSDEKPNHFSYVSGHSNFISFHVHFLLPWYSNSGLWEMVLCYFTAFMAFHRLFQCLQDARMHQLAVFVCLFTAVFCGFGPTLAKAREWGVMFIWELSYNKWATEAIYSDEIAAYRHIYDIEASTKNYGFNFNQYSTDLWYMFLIDTLTRVITFGLMIYLHRDKQK